MGEASSSDRGRWIRAAVEQFEGPLLRYAAGITGDLERGRDVVQDTFLRLCREDPSDIDGHLAQWLYTVCRNRALDVRKKEDRMKTMTTEEAAVQPSRDAGQTAIAEHRDSTDRVLQVVEGLSENQREVVRLKFEHGLSYREISRVTDLSVSNVGYLIHTAVQKIRKELNVECS